MVGSFLLSNTYGGAEFRNIVSDIIVHPKYKKISTFQDEYTYDFAMMKIEAVTLPNLVPVVLNADESNPQLNQSLTTVGYGRISASGSYAHSPELRKTTLKAGGDCDYAFSESYNSNVSLCALAPKTDACQGKIIAGFPGSFIFPFILTLGQGITEVRCLTATTP